MKIFPASLWFNSLSLFFSGKFGMKINSSKFAENDQNLTFDFDEWVALYKHSPEAFEERRVRWSEQIVKSAPSPYQRRLAGILFQINMEKRRTKNAMHSCLKISEMMWDKFHELNTELQSLAHKQA